MSGVDLGVFVCVLQGNLRPRSGSLVGEAGGSGGGVSSSLEVVLLECSQDSAGDKVNLIFNRTIRCIRCRVVAWVIY